MDVAPPHAISEPAVAPAGRELRVEGLSLRAKGLIALAVLAGYFVFAAVVVEAQRTRLAEIVAEIERVNVEADQLDRVNFSLAQSILTVNERYYRAEEGREFVGVVVAAETVQTGLASLAARFPQLLRASEEVGERIVALVGSGERAKLLELRETLHRVVIVMDDVTGRTRDRKSALAKGYRTQYDAISITWIGLGLVGVLVFAAVLVLFFNRLAWDLRLLQQRSLDVVKGYRGPGLPVTRSDEVGTLMRAVNRMQDELREHESRVELARQQQFHREKMASVGGLAAQIAHEINNPIAAIAGVAQAISQACRAAPCGNPAALEQAEMILEQTRRISLITRQIADFSAPQAMEPALLDLNALVESTCAFVRYDRRFRAIALELDLDRALPAVTAVGDHLKQVLLNLLINAADAISEAGVRGRIVVATRRRGETAGITVTDNGIGMDAATRARAFDEFFTTKPRGKGSGLGLALSRRLLAAAGGEIEIDSRPKAGAVVAVRLPLASPAPPG
jgi:signal transduction histidine kinase